MKCLMTLTQIMDILFSSLFLAGISIMYMEEKMQTTWSDNQRFNVGSEEERQIEYSRC